MKTKEEILHDCATDTLEAGTEIFTKKECLEAMEQYASEQCQKLKIELSFAYGKIDKLNELIEAQEELISSKNKHTSNCWINQNWDEVRMAMSDTPKEFRDKYYHQSLLEIERKSHTCSCGLAELQKKIEILKKEI